MLADELVRMAEQHGFTVKRHATHRIIERGAIIFTLPSTGHANAWTTQAIHNVCGELDRLAQGEKRSLTGYPLTVNYLGRPWAVAGQDFTRYRLQDLDDGKLTWANKEDTQVPDLNVSKTEETQQEEGAPQETVAEVAAAVSRPAHYDRGADRSNGPVTTRIADDLATLNPMKFWELTTERLIRDITDKIDKETAAYEAKVAAWFNERDSLQAALDSIKGGAPPKAVTVRKFSVPTGTNTKPTATGIVRHYPEANTRARARELWMKGRKAQEIYDELKGDVGTLNTIYNWIVKWRQEGGLSKDAPHTARPPK
jgi:hypothetical protein